MATFEKYVDRDSDFRWRLRGRNGRIIAASSEAYESIEALDRSIEIVRQEAPVAPEEWLD